MKVIYSGVEYDYYDRARGLSFEHNNFYGTLKNMEGVQTIYFPYDRILEVGLRRFNEELIDLIRREKPHIFFAVMFTDELLPETLIEIKKHTRAIAWMCDDHWRFHNYSRYYAPYFSTVITTFSKAEKWYLKEGIHHVIRSQWGCNPYYWYPIETPKDIGVSFIGQKTQSRARIIESLKSVGVDVYTRGWGWEGGKVNQEEMIQIINRSKINLNINSSLPFFSLKRFGRLFLKRSHNTFVVSGDIVNNTKAFLNMSIPQIKARPFELGGCRAFVISGLADDMGTYYKEGEEMVFYRNTDELAVLIKEYLNDNSRRESIAEACFRRTLRDHTYEARLRNIFAM
ncbi:MAG: hypothetical protein A2586_01090 [Candidatus Harrisonbacteria bacterium RIFOXYD1_FULL_40_9]|uniref:Spore protein YkvP/CgeB glycosyl transferase-like domain-containing protein n=1 Tax=Candidatus Harrisonbacteria bacterium RIFOXYD1_FULL_40_9 TaxID=1798412 RepID=A0A1G1ZUP9_9BACT|nr:MAG: hypothetical protein A2586_01090 [Candidatus Harrisonbacteria bacterium RIFOXYD1_FULL_40_9]